LNKKRKKCDRQKTERTCIVCRRFAAKEDMHRIAKFEGTVVFDKYQTALGRGCYICKDSKCIDDLTKSKALNKTFKGNVSLKIYEEISKELCQMQAIGN